MGNFPYNISPKMPENQNILMQNPLSIQSNLGIYNRLNMNETPALSEAAHLDPELAEKLDKTKQEHMIQK